MVLNLSNTAEGTNGAAVPASAIGGPNAFDAGSKSGTGTTQTFDSTQAKAGTTSIKHAIAAVASTSYVEWFAAITSASANMYLRGYFYITAVPTNSVSTAVTRFMSMLSTSTAGPALVINGSSAASNPGRIRINDSSGTAAATATTNFPLSQWVRVEWDVTSMTATTANSAARVFSGANLEGATPDYTISATGMTNSAATMNRTRFGPSASITLTSAWNLWMDDLAYSDTATPGPSGSANFSPVFRPNPSRGLIMRGTR